MDLLTLQQRRDEILEGIFALNKRLQAGDKSIEKDAMDERIRALRLVDSEIARAGGASTSGVIRLMDRTGY
jgi:hypothetical protein